MTQKERACSARRSWTAYINRVIAAQISSLTWYFDRTIQWLPRPEDVGTLLAAIQSPHKLVITEGETFPSLNEERHKCSAIP